MKSRQTISKRRHGYQKKTTPKKMLLKSLHRDQKKVLAKRRIRKARQLHKKILLHPIVIMLLICTGVFIVCWTKEVVADRLISATVEAPALSEGAVISSPINESTLTNSPIIVTGSCPADSYIKLYDNNIFSGVDWCAQDGTFNIQTDLFNGKNVLFAQDYNETDLQGPLTPSVAVNYNPSVATKTSTMTGSNTSSTSTNAETKSIAPPLILVSDFHYQTFAVGTDFSWSLNIEGGVPPYTFNIDWGDGQTSKQIFMTDPVFKLSHKYEKPGYYTIIAKSEDASKTSRILQLAALIKEAGSTGMRTVVAGVTPTTNTPLGNLKSFFISTKVWLWVAWPSFIIVLLMVFSFWLGEQEAQGVTSKKKLLIGFRKIS